MLNSLDNLASIILTLLCASLPVVFLLVPWMIGIAYELKGLPRPAFLRRLGRTLVVYLLGSAIGFVAGLLVVLLPAFLFNLTDSAALTIFAAAAIIVAGLVIHRLMRSKEEHLTNRVLPAVFALVACAAVLMTSVMVAIELAEAGAHQGMCGSATRNIAAEVAQYQRTYNALPKSLRDSDKSISRQSILQCRFRREDRDCSYYVKEDFVLIPLPASAPKNLIRLWENPRWHPTDYAWVVDGFGCKMVSRQQLLDLLTETQHWLLANTVISSRPAATQPTHEKEEAGAGQ